MGRSILFDTIGQFTTIPNTVIKMWPTIGEDGFQVFVYLRYRSNERDECWPSYDLIEKDTGLPRKRVAEGIKKLEENGLLSKKKRFGDSTIYTLHLPIPISSSIGALLEEAPVVPQKNYSSVPVELSVVPQVHTNQTQLTRLKEPESRPEIFRLYETEIGPLTGMIADQLKSAEKDYPAEWFPMAFKECADHNARSWKYAEACLKNWKVNGFKSNGKNAQGPSKIVLPSPRLLCGNGDKLKRRAEGLDGTPSFSQALAEYQDHLATCHLCSGASNADSTMAQIKALVKEKSMK